MSLHMAPGMARLTVLGYGWNSDMSIISGDGFTFDGDLWKDIALNLDYEIPDGMEWDNIADSEFNIDLSDIIYTPTDFNPQIDPIDSSVFTNPLGDGIWTNPITGLDYNGVGDMWVPENMLMNMSDALSDIAASDTSLARYAIPDNVIPSLFGGKVSIESEIVYPSDERPHTYTPAVWYIQTSGSTATTFLGEPFYHGTATGGSITVYDEAITIRDGSSKAVYYSGCSTRFTTNYLPSPYNGYPIQYVCWQCLYGSLSNYLLTKTDKTITSDDIKNGTTGLETMDYNGQRYYRMKDKQVANRV